MVYWAFRNAKVDLITKVATRENFELFMWFSTMRPASANLMSIRLVSADKTYEPLAIEERVYRSCGGLFCYPNVEKIPYTEDLRSSLYVALFPKEIEKLSEFRIQFPSIVVQDMPVNWPPVTFTKTAGHFVIRC
jgi:hypothetical protein